MAHSDHVAAGLEPAAYTGGRHSRQLTPIGGSVLPVVDQRLARSEPSGGMRLRMLQDVRASADGINLNEYQAGEVYDLGGKLTTMFLREGWAVDAAAPPVDDRVAPARNRVSAPKRRKSPGAAKRATKVRKA